MAKKSVGNERTFQLYFSGPSEQFLTHPPTHPMQKRKKVEKVNKMPKYAISEMITLKVLWKQNKKQQYKNN